MIDQKQNGVIFTPEWIAKFMTDDLFKNREISGDEKILDAGSGDGIFAVLIAKKFSEIAQKSIEKVISENIFSSTFPKNTSIKRNKIYKN